MWLIWGAWQHFPCRQFSCAPRGGRRKCPHFPASTRHSALPACEHESCTFTWGWDQGTFPSLLHHKGDIAAIHKRSKMFFWKRAGKRRVVRSFPIQAFGNCWICSLCARAGQELSCLRGTGAAPGAKPWTGMLEGSLQCEVDPGEQQGNTWDSKFTFLALAVFVLLLSTPSHPQLFSTKPEPMSPQTQGEPRELWLISLW